MKKISINFQLGQIATKEINNWKHSHYKKEVSTKLYSIFYPNLDLTYSLEIDKEYRENNNLLENKANLKKRQSFFDK